MSRDRMALAGGLRVAALVASIVLAFVACRDASPDDAEPVTLPLAGPLVLDGVTIVDTRDGGLAPDMRIVMDGGRIVRIEPTGTAPQLPGVQWIDASGKFVVPGLLDMHVHPFGHGDPTDSLALMLANGITGFRQMDGAPPVLAQRRAGTLPITLDSPRMLATPGPVLTPFNAPDPERAAAAVDAQREQGADFIKVGLATPDVLFAALAEARRIGIPLAGHVPADVSVVEASRAGMRSIEHLGPGNGVLLACSEDAEALLRSAPSLPGLFAALPFSIPFADQITGTLLADVLVNPAAIRADEFPARTRRMLDTYSEARCRRVAAEFVANDTWQVPTLVRIRSSDLAFEPEWEADPNLRYVPRATLAKWRAVTADYGADLSAEDRQTYRDAYAKSLEIVKQMDAEGVKMLAGSDAVGAGWLVPGFSLHREFDELERAGLSPLRVLQMTTLDGAEFLGRTDTMGTVEVGKDADLVLLDANPVEAVQNLHAIHAVVRSGFYRSKSDLDALKEGIASRAGSD